MRCSLNVCGSGDTTCVAFPVGGVPIRAQLLPERQPELLLEVSVDERSCPERSWLVGLNVV